MSVLVLRHEHFEHLGHFAKILDQKKEAFVYHYLGDPFELEAYNRLIVMGGPMSANDPLPGLADELALIEHAIGEGVPVLGICLGAQLIAKALGSPVYRNAHREIGWAPVHFTAAGQLDPLFSSFPSPTTFLHWHGETFDLPARAEWLAYSDKCRHQAFRIGRKVYGVQFHPEITSEMIVDWSSEPVNCGDVSTLTCSIDPGPAGSDSLARKILGAWLNLA
jgi:GMP synthase (glutamine-hydrolysing)